MAVRASRGDRGGDGRSIAGAVDAPQGWPHVLDEFRAFAGITG